MTPLPHDRESDSSTPSRVVRWTGWLDENGERAHAFDVYPSAEWQEKWAPPCPDGKPQRLRRALGFRERSVSELELRVALGGDDGGVCQIIVEEHEEEVRVRVLVHSEPERSATRPRDYVDCPVRVWLDKPLAKRAVIDIDSDEELPLFIPSHLDNVLHADDGHHAANRRRRPRRA